MKYSFDIVSVGKNVLNLLKTSRCVALVGEGCCSEGIASVSIIHSKADLMADVTVGDTLSWGSLKFKITNVASDINKNISDCGHFTLVFNEDAVLPGQISVEGDCLPVFINGEHVSIY